ncbi:SusC/RagA family TonB-linked outer membrane protein [Carboxylicivirga marina]|uniref:TonB-dependent receptor n=1 Tax=Carboxylicivirga marina TaxID=2800988 RepID=A0ABS1HIX4_9BACT|nr:TonB-dependent receptor [Carboxylicivirga marina]MBK3517516.1 TonB-dependent receptor [Carboxylicivirga marina]
MKKLLTNLLCLLIPVFVLAQERTITGKVVDSETNEPIPGVNVIVLPAYRGTITDMEGNYSLADISSSDQVQFSFIGFANQTIVVGEQSTIDVKLVPDVNELDEVVAIGYGVMKKSDLTGAVSSVGLEQIQMTENISLDQALEGRVAGLNVSSGDGTLGAATNIFIRGVGSINSNTQPLFVIDGFPIEYSYDKEATALGDDPLNPLVNINPDDIESIEVLKDASAAAIYGARGANGVILITTKRGEAGKTNVTVNASFGFKKPMKKVDMLETPDYSKYMYEKDAGEEWDDWKAWQSPDSTNTDWQDVIYDNRYALSQRYDISIDGGSEQTTFRTNINYKDESGVIQNTSLQSFSGALKVNHKAGRWMDMFMDVNLATSGNSSSAQGTGSTPKSGGSVINALQAPPTKEPDEEATQDELENDDESNGGYTNPLTMIHGVTNKKRNTDMRVNTQFLFKLHPSLTLMLRGGYRLSFAERSQYYPSNTGRGNKNNGDGFNSTNNKSSLLGESTLTYLTTINKDHNINIMGGVSYTENVDWFWTARNTNYGNNDLAPYNMAVGTAPLVPESWYEKPKLQSFLGRFNYNYKSRYLATASFRADGSSKFGAGNKYAYFPSGALSWRLSEEGFMSGATWVDNLKLRSSIGVTGNQGIPSYLSRDNYTVANYVFDGEMTNGAGSWITNVRDDELVWETSRMIDAGIDFAAFKQRLIITADVYDKETYDMLLNTNVSPSAGFMNDWTNVGSMRNRGVEVSVTGDIFKNAGFIWRATANYAYNENEILKLADSDYILMDGYILQEGMPVGAFHGYPTDGIIRTFEEAAIAPVEVRYTAQGNMPGYRRFKDLNGDGMIDNVDREIIGQGHPDGFGSLSNVLTYKGFQLKALVTFRHGNQVYNATRMKLEYMYGSKGKKNRMATVLDRWRQPYVFGGEDEGNIDGSLPSVEYDDKLFHSDYLEDADYVKLRSISLLYKFPQKMIKDWGFKQLSLRTTAENIWTITGYSGYDPEVSMGRNKGLMPGYDNAGAPTPFILTFGLNARF